MATKLILTHDVTGLGEPGDVVDVKAGYARNYLVPRGLATAWTKGGEAQVESIRRARRAREIATREEALAARDTLQASPVTVTAKAGKGGKLFGAISTADIAEAAHASLGVAVDRRKIEASKAIKSVGDYTVEVHLHPEVSARLAVKVVAA